jgi:predicted transposase YdaD
VREVAVTAREEGKAEGKIEGKAEVKQEMVIEMHLDGIEIERIGKIAKTGLDQVKEIIEAYLRKQERKG